jgi:hypothetical protein
MKDFKSKDTWMVFKIMGEFVEGFETLRDVGPAVSVFGGARFAPENRYYRLAREIGRALAGEGYAVITGGGPGIMEAVSRGVSEAGGKAVGLNIKLPVEQEANQYSNIRVDFDFFFARKVMFMRYAQAYVVLPGGFGTMDEVFEALTLIQTNKIRNFPVILVGSDFWAPLLEWISDRMIAFRTISPEDLRIYRIVDEAAEVMQIIRENSLCRPASVRADGGRTKNGRATGSLAGVRSRTAAAMRRAARRRS